VPPAGDPVPPGVVPPLDPPWSVPVPAGGVPPAGALGGAAGGAAGGGAAGGAPGAAGATGATGFTGATVLGRMSPVREPVAAGRAAVTGSGSTAAGAAG
jgi:hypothetical protein